MDYNFTDMVNEGLRRGRGYEEIAADFTKALNEIQKKYHEEAVREDYIEDCLDRLADWETENCDASLSLAADMATLAAYNTHDYWSTDRLNKFNEDAVAQLEALVALYEMEDEGDPYALDLRRMLDMANEGQKKAEECARSCEGKVEVTGEETLRRCMKAIGL